MKAVTGLDEAAKDITVNESFIPDLVTLRNEPERVESSNTGNETQGAAAPALNDVLDAALVAAGIRITTDLTPGVNEAQGVSVSARNDVLDAALVAGIRNTTDSTTGVNVTQGVAVPARNDVSDAAVVTSIRNTTDSTTGVNEVQGAAAPAQDGGPGTVTKRRLFRSSIVRDGMRHGNFPDNNKRCLNKNVNAASEKSDYISNNNNPNILAGDVQHKNLQGEDDGWKLLVNK